MRRLISRESLILIAICALDTAITAVLVATGRAEEANPLMAQCIRRGIGHFCLVKALTVMPLIIVAESYRRQNPMFVKRVTWAGIGIYIGLYFGLLAVVNAGN